MNTTPELSPRMIELRDGPPQPRTGEARQRQLARLENDISAMADFVADLDRYAAHAAGAHLVGEVVGPFMAHEIARLRAKTVGRAKRMHENLLMLKKMS